MLRRLFLSLPALALSAAALVACTAPTDVDAPDEAEVTVEEALHTGITAGSFKLYGRPNTTPSPRCDLFTNLELKRGRFGAYAQLEQRLDGFCRIAVRADSRIYRLRESQGSCGSRVYVGYRWTREGFSAVHITDHRTRLCKDLVPAKVIVRERTGGWPGVKNTLYSYDGAPPPPAGCNVDADCASTEVCRPGICRAMCLPGEPNCCSPGQCIPAPVRTTVEGTMMRVMGIGGESTGYALATSGGLLELILDASERPLFLDGAKAKITGTKTTLSGVETRNRPALDVETMIACPESGTWVNCMPMGFVPGQPRPQGNLLCGETTWVRANCPGVDFAY